MCELLVMLLTKTKSQSEFSIVCESFIDMSLAEGQ